jgi:ArsR family transcriptional regulator, virulence genes transcriptional regulator
MIPQFLLGKKTVDQEEQLFVFHADLCKMLSNPIRLKIIHFLREKEKSVNELARLCHAPQATLSQHLGLMRQRGMLATRKKGTTVYYRLANPKMIEAFDLMREILSERLLEMQKMRKALSG